MFFQRYAPGTALDDIIECFWIVEDDDPVPRHQKIIPDGFNEIIFHYGDPYRINLDGEWKLQSRNLLAGQIRKHFSLENTGRSGIVAIKLKPTALTHLYGLSMQSLTDSVVDVSTVLGDHFSMLEKELTNLKEHSQKIAALKEHFRQLMIQKPFVPTAADSAVQHIFSNHGMSSVAEIAAAANMGERQLENVFRKYIGLSPKFFSRIIRFNYIFQLVQENDQSWTSVAYEAAFFDQSHFIRNFRDFTGENPTGYSFDEKNMANFFLLKK